MAVTTSKGICEFCSNAEPQELTKQHGDMMCASCIKLENDATARAVETNSMIQEARRVDTTIEIKMDVFTANTVSAVDIKAAIDNDANIPANMKDFVMAQESLKRMRHFQQMIVDSQNAARAWQVQVQQFAGKLAQDEAEKFKQYSMTYAPTPVKGKANKPAKASTPSTKTINRQELSDAAKKYGVPMASVQSLHYSKPGMTYDAAAAHVAKLLGLLPDSQ